MSKRGPITFAVWQLVGEFAAWVWPHSLSPLGPYLWITAVVLLLPGNFLTQWFTEKFFWNMPIPTSHLRLAQIPVEVTINAGSWILVGHLWRLLKEGRRAS